MAVQNDTSRIQYNGNNSTVSAYSVPFPFFENSHIRCVVTSSSGVDTELILGSGFTLTGAGNPSGGNLLTTSAVPTSSKVTIFRNVPATQTTSYQEGGDFPAASHERALDKLTMIAQQIKRSADRALKVPETQNNPNDLPNAGSGSRILASQNGSITWEQNTLPPVAPNVAGPLVLTSAGNGGPSYWNGVPSLSVDASALATVKQWPVGVSKLYYVSARTDTNPGNGTLVDPYDGSTALKLRAIVTGAPQGSTIVLLPGNYETYGYLDLPTGVSLLGSGMNNTTIKLIGPGGAGHPNPTWFGVVHGKGDNVTLADFCCDCNWQNVRVANKSSGGALIQGFNGIIERVWIKNAGGDGTNSSECFPLNINGSGTIRSCKFTDPQAGWDNAAPYITCMNFVSDGYPLAAYPDKFAYGTFENNYVNGLWNGQKSSFAFMGGSNFTHVVMRGNTAENCVYGINGDSNISVQMVIENNQFRNCRRSVNLGFSRTSQPGVVIANPSNSFGDGYLRHVIVRNNLFAQPTDSFAGGGAGRFVEVETVEWIGNLIYRQDQNTSALYEGGPVVINCQRFVHKDNIIYNNIGAQVPANTGYVEDANNTDEFGIPRFEVALRLPSIVVPVMPTNSARGKALARAIAWLRNASPNGVSKSVTNRATVFLPPGDYPVPTDPTLTIPLTMGNGFMSIVGLSTEAASTRIYCATAGTSTVDCYYGNAGYYTFKNLTLLGNNAVAFGPPNYYTTNGPFLEMDNVILTSTGANGACVPSGSNVLGGVWRNCQATGPMVGSNGQGVLAGKFYDCIFPDGFSQVGLAGAELHNCQIGGNATLGLMGGGTLTDITMKNCIIKGHSSVNQSSIVLAGNSIVDGCYFSKAKITVTGTGVKMFNTVLEMHSSSTECIGGAAGTEVTLFSVGSNKSVSNDVTKTNLTSL